MVVFTCVTRGLYSQTGTAVKGNFPIRDRTRTLSDVDLVDQAAHRLGRDGRPAKDRAVARWIGCSPSRISELRAGARPLSKYLRLKLEQGLRPDVAQPMPPASPAVARLVERGRGVVGLLLDAIYVCPLPIVVIDRKHRVVMWNHAMTELFGFVEEDVFGLHPPPYVNPDVPGMLQNYEENIARALKGGKLETTVTRWHKARHLVTVDVTVCGVLDAEDRPLGVIAVFRPKKEEPC